jgi:hypothetical protein
MLSVLMLSLILLSVMMLIVILLSVVTLSVVMLSVIMLSVVMPNVLAPNTLFRSDPTFLANVGCTLVEQSPHHRKVKGLSPAAEAGLLNERLMLSSSFRCDQVNKYELYHFGHTLLCYLSQNLMFN